MAHTGTSKKAILLAGATGKQGGATVRALLEAGALEHYRILAVTRNAESRGAKNLAAKGVDLVQGDFNDIPGIFETAKGVLGGDDKLWGVFSVQACASL